MAVGGSELGSLVGLEAVCDDIINMADCSYCLGMFMGAANFDITKL